MLTIKLNSLSSIPMDSLENACRLLGDSLKDSMARVARMKNGTGFNTWTNFEDTVHVDFFGFSDLKEVDVLRNLALGLHKSLEIDGHLQVDFFATHLDAEAAMISSFEDCDE